MTPPGIEPATFRFVVQHLNHCATAVPQPVRNTIGIVGRKERFVKVYVLPYGVRRWPSCMELSNRTPQYEPETDHVSFLVHDTSHTPIQEPIREEIS